jgi:hypothetical protein
MCASAPALKVFFKQYLNVASLSSTLQNSWRTREFHRKGYTEESGTSPYGTNSSVTKSGSGNSSSLPDTKGTQTDVELGEFGKMGHGIAVTHEFDIESRPDTRDTVIKSEHSSQEGLRGSHIRSMSKADAPWLEIDPPSDTDREPRRFPSLRK